MNFENINNSTSVSIDDLMNGDTLNVICSFLEKNNLSFEKQPFHSPFGIGYNVIVQFNNNCKQDIIVTAHYDGKGIVDNNGGVFITLLLLQNEKFNNTEYNYVFVFTDKEEDFQFGTKAFLDSKYWGQKEKIKYHFNIDGIGIGDSIVIYPSEEYYINKWINDKTTVFQTDCSPSVVKNIPTYHIFSCLKEDAETIVKEQKLGKCISKYMDEEWCSKNFDFKYFEELSKPIYSMLINGYYCSSKFVQI